MTMRYLPIGAALLITLSGCATQQAAGPVSADPLDKRLGNIEGIATLALDRGQATQNMVGDLNRKLDALAGDMARLRDGVANQDSRQRELADKLADQLARNAQSTGQQAQSSAAAQAERLGQVEKRLAELAAQTRDNTAQAASLQAILPSLRDKANESAATAAARSDGLDARLAKIEKRLEEVAGMAQDALDATGMGQRRIVGKVVHSVTLTDDKTLFPINSPTLGEKDMAKLDELAAKVKAMGTWFHLQIQGHTDGFGSEDYNYDLGRARAEVVKGYLNEKGGIPLLRMSVISYGASEMANYAGKSNRRIVVHVLQ
jgi:outer membrane protein OmpA-like peptidoglycan-associated protein